MEEAGQSLSMPDEANRVFPHVTRRSVLKSFALGGLGAVAGGIALPFMSTPIAQAVESIGAKEETLVWNACLVNCGSRCPLKCHVVDGVIR